MPACAAAQLPESIASNTPRQSRGTAIVGAGGVTATGGWADGGLVWVTVGAPVIGASGSGEGCAITGAAHIKAPNAITPDLTTRPPSATTNPSMPRLCLRVD